MVNQASQHLLLDTDAYCKLEVAGLFVDAATSLGVPIEACGRLAALPYMLRRGRLREKLGADASDAMLPKAERIPVAIQPSEDWLSPLAAVTSIDPGEAQLLAASAEHEILLLTNDKRGIRGIKDISRYAKALDGRIVVLEAILIELCERIGLDVVRSRIRPLMNLDTAVRLSFSDAKSSPLVGLMSFYRSLAFEVSPLGLWQPPSPGGI